MWNSSSKTRRRKKRELILINQYHYRKLRKKKEDYEQSKKAECTFKPQILEYNPNPTSEANKKPSKHVKVSTSKSTADRCQVLYELAKKIVKKEDKPTDDYIYEKEQKEYTFAPNLVKEKIEPVAGSTNDPLIGETIERLKKAREERDRIKKGTERGVEDSGMRFDMESNKFKKGGEAEHSKQLHSGGSTGEPNTVKKDSARKKEPVEAPKEPEHEHEPEPEQKEPEDDKVEEKLYIDVNLGENVERIIVHKGDTAEGLANKFADEHRTFCIA